jgi:rhodanese-related sulfurtransferase
VGRLGVLAVAALITTPLAAAAASSGGLGMSLIEWRIRRAFPRVATVTTAELATELTAEAPLLLLDVRSADEFAVSHLAGAVRLDPAALAATSELPEVLRAVPQERAIVVYCAVGYRSAGAAAELGKRGFDRVRNLEGSIFAWANEGRALVRTAADGREEPAVTVHPYDALWGRLLRPESRAQLPP